MSGPATATRSRRPRRRPFGVLAICALLIFQAGVLAVAVVALLASATGSDTGTVDLTVFGVSLSISTDEGTLQKILVGLLSSLALFTVLQVVLLLALRRAGWVLTMLLVGFSLTAQLYGIWKGTPTNTLSLFIDALTALYLNQSEVRKAFGVSAGRVDAAIGRSADVVVDATLGGADVGEAA